ncbi:hypothetical protein M5X17_31320 [Paenibacillus alvei]|uniref:hypothetical protein n=1 Tax=Paenibacillus alvei TaxID=44250 RepID=UPI0022831DD8|nr:hypothetical protein [Paenibacillus alvei]MCY9738185.1 hypothetical protein [Paenibacillus alvei]
MNNGQVISLFINGETEAKANYLFIKEQPFVTELISFGMCIAVRVKETGMIDINEDIPYRMHSLSHKQTDTSRKGVQLRLIRETKSIAPDKLRPITGIGLYSTFKCPYCNEKITTQSPSTHIKAEWEKAVTCYLCNETSLVEKTADSVNVIATLI